MLIIKSFYIQVTLFLSFIKQSEFYIAINSAYVINYEEIFLCNYFFYIF